MMKNKMTRILALVIVLSMIFTTVAFAAPKHKQFEHYNKKYDLKEEDYENALKELIDKKIVKGYGNGDYGLSGNVKRGDVIVMIIRMLEEYKKLDLDKEETLKDVFEDVYKNDYYYDSVKKANKLGIAKGDGKNFKPNKPVTVQEAIWLVARASNSLGLNIEEKDVIEELKGIYEDELNKFAKRRDVFWMIYYILGGVEPDDQEQDDFLTYRIDINEVLNFDGEVEDDIIDAFKEKTKNNLDKIKFALPSEREGALYFNYETKNESEVPSEKFSASHVEDITFVPKKVGEVKIKYTAYDENDKGYSETIIIIVENTRDILTYRINLNSVLDFNDEVEEDIKSTFKDKMTNDLNKIKFVLPDKIDGILYFDYDTNNTTKVPNIEFSGDHIGDITFVPKRVGNVNIKYTAYDKYGHDYSDTITIIVEKEFKIPNLTKNMKLSDKETTIDFKTELKGLLNNNTLFNNFETVKFILPTNFNGALSVNVGVGYKAVGKIEYDLDKIVGIKYKPDTEGTVNIEYIVYDEDGKSYDGLIKILVDKGTILEINEKINENSLFKLKKEFFKDFLDEVKFVLPESKNGVLYEEVRHSDGVVDLIELTNGNRTFKYNELGNIYYEPVQDTSGKVTIEFIGYDGDVRYTGKINLTIRDSYDLNTINWDIDEENTDDFELDLTYKLNKLKRTLDYVKIVNPTKGSLSLKYDGVYTNIKEKTEYRLDDIEKMFYHPNGEGPIYIYYTAYDGDVAYDGAIRIYVVD